LVLAVSSALALASAAAFAQQAPATKADSAGQLEDIVITATKRSSTVQDTPISVTAVSGEDIQDRGISDFTALAQSIPGISMRSSGPGQTEFEMRGMTSAGGNSSTVGFYLDDTPLTAPAAAQNGKVVIDPNLYDLNRVEVLRGPQGTLYGSGSMGGTIKVVPNAPNPAAFDASAEGVFGETQGGGFNHAENAMVNLPLGDTAALRIVGTSSHDSGWIDRVVIANGDFPAPTSGVRGNVAAAPVGALYKDVNYADVESVRASLLWKPTDQLTIEPSFMYQRIYQGGLSDIDSNPGTMTNFQPFDQAEPFSDNFQLGSLKIEYHFPVFDLTSATSYWTRDEHLRQDGSEEIADVIGIPYYIAAGGFGATTPTPLEDDATKQTSEELRLTSNTDSAFKWLAGFFYSDFQSQWNLFVLQPGALGPTGTGDGFTQYQPTKIIQNAFFGEVSYDFTSALKGTVGARRYYYTGSVNTAVSGYLSSAYSPGAPNAFAYATAGENNQGVNPKFDLSYQISKDLMIYGTAAKGFRPGGGNQPIPTSGALGSQCEAQLQANHGTTSFVAAPNAFGPDDVWSYELGEKWRSESGRFTVNGDVYYEKWNGVQQNIPLACGFPYTDNAGDAQVNGAELELNAVVVPGLVFAANAGYTHAVFVGFNLETGIASGTPVQDVPNWTSSASLSYKRSIGNDLNLTARAENNYVGGHYDATAQINHLPSYDLTNLRIGVEGDHWSAVLFAKNVFNTKALLTDVAAINVNVSEFNRVAVGQPATYGIDLNYHFGH
jgi:outer membrane receptor protein involved in Fe transport